MQNNKTIKISLFIFLTLTSFILWGCDENGGITIPSGTSELTVNVKSDDNLNDNGIISITEVKALISQVEFEKESDGRDQLHMLGPIVVRFNTDGQLTELSKQFLIRDIYTKVKFQIHKPEDTETPSDPEFKEGNSGNQRFSFIVKGIYNGNSFIYKSKKSINIVINFPSSENINLATSSVTVLFNKIKWFKNGSDDINPSDPQFENMIDDNINSSFSKVIRDDDKNGIEDH